MTHLDDASIDASLARRSLTAAESEALARARHFMEQGDFTARRQSRTFAMEVLAGGAAAIVVIGLVLTFAHHAPASPPPAPTHPVTSPTPMPSPTPSPSAPTQTTVPPHILQQVGLGSGFVNAMAVSPDVVWLATQGVNYGDAGTLIRVDAATGRRTASWSIGGDPAAVAAAGGYVWVANGFGDGSKVLPEQNTVEQFNATTGRVMHIYRILDPRALVANTTSALLMSAPNQEDTAITLLEAGTTKAVGNVPGGLQGAFSAPQAVAVCANEVYLTVSNATNSGTNVVTYSVHPTGGTVREIASVPNDFLPVTTCDSTDVFVAAVTTNGEGSIVRVSIANGSVSRLWGGPNPSALAFLSGRVWLTYLAHSSSSGSYLTSIDPVTGATSPTRTILPAPPNRGDPYLLVPGGLGLWVQAGVGNLMLHIAVG